MKKSASLRGFSAYRIWAQLPSVEISYLPDVLMFGAGIAVFYGVLVVGRTWLGPFHSSGRNLAQSTRPRSLRRIFTLANHHRILAEPRLYAHLRIRRRLQPARRALHDSTSGRVAIDPRAQFSSRRNAGHGGLISWTATGSRSGRNSADLHRSGLEHGVQLLRVIEEHSQRDARSRKDLPLQLVAALY